jgi:hypothetical protein
MNRFILFVLLGLFGAAAIAQQTYSSYVAGLPSASAFVGSEYVYILQNGRSTKTTVAAIRSAVLSGFPSGLVPSANAQSEPFSTYVNGLPLASTPFSGAENVYILQGGVSTKTTIAALLGQVTPAQPALLPAEPISPAPSIDANFTTASYSGCSSFSNCFTLTRTETKACASLLTSPGITYAPTNTPCITDYGLAINGVSTNNFLWSEDFTNPVWVPTNVNVISNSGVAPDGNSTADLVTLSTETALAIHALQQNNLPFVIGQVNTESYFVKPISVNGSVAQRYFSLTFSANWFSGVKYANFDAQTCTPVATGVSSTQDSSIDYSFAKFQAIANGWCRIGITATVTTNSSGAGAVNISPIPFPNQGRGQTWIASGQTFLMWGANLTVSAGGISSYIPTTTAPVTVDADVVQPNGPLLSLVSGAQGFLVDDLGQTGVQNQYIISRNGTTDAFLKVETQSQIAARVSGADVAAAPVGSIPVISQGPSNVGISWDGSGVNVVANGGPVIASATPFGSTINSFIGSADGSTGATNGYHRRIFAGTTKPSNTTLLAYVPAQGPPFGTPGVAFYFSGSGSDSNNCLSPATACQTISKANNPPQKYLYSDTINLDGATPFIGCLALNKINTPLSIASLPIVIQPYNGATAQITSNCSGETGGVSTSGIDGVTVQDIVLISGGPNTRGGVYIAGPANGITVQRMDISGFSGSGFSQFAGQVFVNGTTGSLSNISVINNTLHGNSGSPTAVGDEGIGGFGINLNIFNVNYSGNLIFNLGGQTGTEGAFTNGIVFGSVSGGTANFDIMHDIGANVHTCGGPTGLIAFGAANIVASFDESYNIQPTTFMSGQCDHDPFDFDGGVANSVLEYDYAHDSLGVGFLHFCGSGGSLPWNDNQTRYSISEHNGRAFYPQNVCVRSSIFNNTAWQNATIAGWLTNSGVGICCGAGGASTGIIANNIIAVTSGGFFVTTNGVLAAGVTYSHNDYFAISGSPTWVQGTVATYPTLAQWQAVAPGGDPGSIITNPGLSGTGGTGGTCSWTPNLNNGPQPCPAQYVLAGGSAMKSAGIDLTMAPYNLTVGTRDYYANTVPGSGACWNIGAYGTCP